MTTIKDKTAEAIQAIITYHTLPSQIDYRQPQKIKLLEAEDYLDSLPESERKAAYQEAKESIDAYYTPIGDLEYSPAELDEMF